MRDQSDLDINMAFALKQCLIKTNMAGYQDQCMIDLIASAESSKSNAIVLAPMDEMTKFMGSIADIEIEANKAKYRAIFSQLDG